jgi:hypothetical protein
VPGSASPERRPLGRPGDLPQGFGALAGVPTAARSVAKPRSVRHGLSCRSPCGRSHGRGPSSAQERASPSWA